jgi:hypothetical protein
MAVDRHREHIRPLIKNVLLTISVVMVDIEDRNLTVGTQVVGRDGGGIEIAKPAERPTFSMMTGRTDESIGQPVTLKKFHGRGQRTIHGSLCSGIGIMGEGREGIDTIVTGPYGELLRRTGDVPDGKNIRVDRFSGLQVRAYPLEIFDKLSIVHRFDVRFREMPGGKLLKQACSSQFP